jgi:aldose 1-epimerase
LALHITIGLMPREAMTDTVHPSGAQYEIQFGDQWACAVEVGGGLRAYSVQGRPVLEGYAIDELCQSARGQVLAPWPNRISGGGYSFDGEHHQLPITEPSTGNAIHGLVRWDNWKLADRSDERVALEHVLHPQPGYPFAVHLRVEYTLDEGGLTVTTIATNVGDRAFPFGLGHHPYLAGAPTVDELVLHVPARTPADFVDPRAIGAAVLDTTYTDLERDDDGLVRIRVGDAILWADEAYGYLQVFTGDLPEVERRGLAVEPMTCPPQAFRTGEGLIRLEPGACVEARWGIERLRAT